MGDVIQGICEKMIYRHPHVFGSGKADTAEEVLINWEELKKKEKRQETQTEVMQSVPAVSYTHLDVYKRQRVGVPIGRTQAHKGRHEIDTAGIGNLSAKSFCFPGGGNQPQFIAQPLDCRACNENRALQCVGDFAT